MPTSLIDWPNQDIGELQQIYPSMHYDPKKDELSGLFYHKPQNIGEQLKSWIKALGILGD